MISILSIIFEHLLLRFSYYLSHSLCSQFENQLLLEFHCSLVFQADLINPKIHLSSATEQSAFKVQPHPLGPIAACYLLREVKSSRQRLCFCPSKSLPFCHRLELKDCSQTVEANP
jgi:hypothetical protein